jgi:hypothetical protein
MKPSTALAVAAVIAAAATLTATSGAPPAPAARPSGPIRTVSGGDPTARLSLLALRRTGRVVTAKLRLSVVRDPGLLPYEVDIAADGGREGTADGLRLYDDTGGSTIMPLRDPDGGCSCSRGLGDLAEGDSVAVFARFAVPAGREALTLDAPGFPPFYDVPVATG